ncbi:hypothetical protein ACFYRY_39905 [Streptomyces sp. NPDC005263]|uniref:hypothetical protein n=1 Tax=Streptomyces sp. NPDC005263 TaxID=3364711 RepID=UPI0036B21CED
MGDPAFPVRTGYTKPLERTERGDLIHGDLCDAEGGRPSYAIRPAAGQRGLDEDRAGHRMVEARANRRKEQACVGVCHQGDGAAGRDLPKAVADGVGNTGPEGGSEASR